MPYVYILYSEKLDKFYVGACTDLNRRLYEHNIGHSKFTSTGVPWILKYEEKFDSLPLAKKREVALLVEHPDFYREGLGFESQPVHKGVLY